MPHLGEAEHQGFDFKPCERLRRQGDVFRQPVAEAALAIDDGTRGAQALDVPIERTQRHAGLLCKACGRDRGGEIAKRLEQAKQTITTSHDFGR